MKTIGIVRKYIWTRILSLGTRLPVAEPKNIILKIRKIHSVEKLIIQKTCENGQKRAKKWPFLGPGVPNFDPFFKMFCKSLLNMPKTFQKNSLTRKISKSEKLRKWPKMGQKCPFFGPGGPNFDPFYTIF